MRDVFGSGSHQTPASPPARALPPLRLKAPSLKAVRALAEAGRGRDKDNRAGEGRNGANTRVHDGAERGTGLDLYEKKQKMRKYDERMRLLEATIKKGVERLEMLSLAATEEAKREESRGKCLTVFVTALRVLSSMRENHVSYSALSAAAGDKADGRANRGGSGKAAAGMAVNSRNVDAKLRQAHLLHTKHERLRIALDVVLEGFRLDLIVVPEKLAAFVTAEVSASSAGGGQKGELEVGRGKEEEWRRELRDCVVQLKIREGESGEVKEESSVKKVVVEKKGSMTRMKSVKKKKTEVDADNEGMFNVATSPQASSQNVQKEEESPSKKRLLFRGGESGLCSAEKEVLQKSAAVYTRALKSLVIFAFFDVICLSVLPLSAYPIYTTFAGSTIAILSSMSTSILVTSHNAMLAMGLLCAFVSLFRARHTLFVLAAVVNIAISCILLVITLVSVGVVTASASGEGSLTWSLALYIPLIIEVVVAVGSGISAAVAAAFYTRAWRARLEGIDLNIEAVLPSQLQSRLVSPLPIHGRPGGVTDSANRNEDRESAVRKTEDSESRMTTPVTANSDNEVVERTAKDGVAKRKEKGGVKREEEEKEKEQQQEDKEGQDKQDMSNLSKSVERLLHEKGEKEDRQEHGGEQNEGGDYAVVGEVAQAPASSEPSLFSHIRNTGGVNGPFYDGFDVDIEGNDLMWALSIRHSFELLLAFAVSEELPNATLQILRDDLTCTGIVCRVLDDAGKDVAMHKVDGLAKTMKRIARGYHRRTKDGSVLGGLFRRALIPYDEAAYYFIQQKDWLSLSLMRTHNYCHIPCLAREGFASPLLGPVARSIDDLPSFKMEYIDGLIRLVFSEVRRANREEVSKLVRKSSSLADVKRDSPAASTEGGVGSGGKRPPPLLTMGSSAKSVVGGGDKHREKLEKTKQKGSSGKMGMLPSLHHADEEQEYNTEGGGSNGRYTFQTQTGIITRSSEEGSYAMSTAIAENFQFGSQISILSLSDWTSILAMGALALRRQEVGGEEEGESMTVR